MKICLTLLLISFSALSFAAFDQAALENAAAMKLEIENLETFDWKIEQGPLADVITVEFTYDMEFFSDYSFDIVTFTCSGTVVNSQSPVFSNLECVEEEPLLWEE